MRALRLKADRPLYAALFGVGIVLSLAGCGDKDIYRSDALGLELTSDYSAELIIELTFGNVGPTRKDVEAHSYTSIGLPCRSPKTLSARSIDPYKDDQLDRSRPSPIPGQELDRQTWPDLQCPAQYDLRIDREGYMSLTLRRDGQFDS